MKAIRFAARNYCETFLNLNHLSALSADSSLHSVNNRIRISSKKIMDGNKLGIRIQKFSSIITKLEIHMQSTYPLVESEPKLRNKTSGICYNAHFSTIQRSRTIFRACSSIPSSNRTLAYAIFMFIVSTHALLTPIRCARKQILLRLIIAVLPHMLGTSTQDFASVCARVYSNAGERSTNATNECKIYGSYSTYKRRELGEMFEPIMELSSKVHFVEGISCLLCQW